MKRNNVCLTTKCVGHRIDLSKAASQVAIGSLALLLGLTAVGTPLRAATTSVYISSNLWEPSPAVYLFDSANTPILAASATIVEGGVYTDSVCLGIIDANQNIVDANANIIGYVVGYVSPPHPD